MTEAVTGEEPRELRRGWTTGACAAAAAKAACAAMLGKDFLDPVQITLPGGQTPSFALARHWHKNDAFSAAIVKDAGDDPDVTHGALIVSTVRRGFPGSGISFKAGPGVGTVTRPGLPVPPGEPAINPMPRKMIAQAIAEIAGDGADVEVEVSVPDGEEIATRTLNGRLGIVGGISILGTTGIVIPYSCSAWIHSIHRGVDVARGAGLQHVAGATGSTSEKAVQQLYDLPDFGLIDMGDFVGGMLKYIRVHPVERVTVAGGVAKMTKLAQGMLDLHSKRGAADLDALATIAVSAGADDALANRVRSANTVSEAFQIARAAAVPLGDVIARDAWKTAASVLRNVDVQLEIVVFDREGSLLGRSGFARGAHESRPLKRR